MITRREVALAVVVMGFGFGVVYKATDPKRELRRRNHCYSNLKQIGFGLLQYAQDNDETWPRAWSGHDPGPSDAQTNYKWMDAIFPYVRDTQAFTCPKDQTNKPYRYRKGHHYGSYVLNNAYFLPGDAQTPPAGARWDKIAYVGTTVLVTEGEHSFQCAWPDAQHTPALVGNNPFQFDSIRGRHGSGTHGAALALACDGSTSTALYSFMQRTKLVKGQRIYTAFTIEDDEPSTK